MISETTCTQDNPTGPADETTPGGSRGSWVHEVLLRPPRIALALVLGAAAMDGWFDFPRILDWPWRGLGGFALGAGVALSIGTLKLFEHARTTHNPYGRPTALILSGPYRFSRNPMYVGVVLVVLGVGLLVGTPALMSCWLAFGWILDARFIPREEAALEREFGSPYARYRAQVRRWL